MGIYFQAFGAPVPKQSFVYTKNGGGFIAPRVKNWQTVVALAAKEAVAQVPAWQPYQGAVWQARHRVRAGGAGIYQAPGG